MTDWAAYVLTALEVDEFPADAREKALNAASLDYTGDTNLQSGMMRINKTTGLLEEYNGSSWVEFHLRESNLVTRVTSTISTSSDTLTSAGAIDGAITLPSSGYYAIEAFLDVDADDSGIEVRIGDQTFMGNEQGITQHFSATGDLVNSYRNEGYLGASIPAADVAAHGNVLLIKGVLRTFASNIDLQVEYRRVTASTTAAIQTNSYITARYLGD